MPEVCYNDSVICKKEGKAMSEYGEKVRVLREKVLRKAHLEKLLEELDIQLADLEDKVYRYGLTKDREQKEADRLEGRSLAAFVYTVLGKKDEKLEKEQREAREAAVRYDAAARELEAVRSDIERYRAELISLRDCEAELESATAAAVAEIKASAMPEKEEIIHLEQEKAELLNKLKELDEAVAAGDTAHKTVSRIVEKLDKAVNMGEWDLFGGGMLPDIMKHGYLDEAQELVGRLQTELRRFRTELYDVDFDADFRINEDGFLRFADYFFDGFFVDLASLHKIEKSRENVANVRRELEKVLNTIVDEQISVDEKLAALKEKLEALIISIS